MPNKPMRPCNKPGCRALVVSGYCDIHKKAIVDAYEDHRGTSNERGYGNTWALVRRMKLNEFPLCERCARVQRITNAILVHHKDRNPMNNLFENFESLCRDCHNKEHKEERWGK